MGEQPSKPVKPLTNEGVIRIMDQYPEAVLQYFEENRAFIEKYVEENFWEEDVEGWLKAIRSRSPKEQLQIRKVDFLLEVNKDKNKTAQYENKNLVIRRASQFEIDVHFGNREFDPERDDLSVVLGVGAKPSDSTGTKFTCFAKKQLGPANEWSCAIVSNAPKRMRLKINVPANAIVGRYKVALDIVSGVASGREKSTYKAAGVIVLFNPFSKDDTVYMENESFRQEYVLNDEGLINYGSYGINGEGIGEKAWDFAQFDEGVLDAVLLMLQNDTRIFNKPDKNLKKCSSPVFVSRVMAAMVNCADDKGVLLGRWDGQYSDAKKPTYWKSSADILREWKESDLSPVKYGQCWVFSGVLTTALRALGIPARSVTNFESAHDTDRNETVDIYMSSRTFRRLDETSDSVWNFHVWNEGYFRRPDLGKGYDGWQVVDATPQEPSDVVDPKAVVKVLMQCGPAPVKAIKEGEINIGYDTAFIFSEVNADKVYWYINEDGDQVWRPTVHKAAIGKFIGTKAVGKFATEDILLQYKYPEGSAEERRAFNKAYSLGSQEHGGDIFNIDRKVVASAFDIEVDGLGDVSAGSDLSATITVKNISDKNHKVEVNISMNSKLHIGKIHASLKQIDRNGEIKPGDMLHIKLDLAADEYMQNLVDNYVVSLVVVVKSTNLGNVEVKEMDVTLDPPEAIEVKAPKSIYGGDNGEYDVVFTNRTPMKLTNGVARIVGRGLSMRKIHIGKPILPNETYSLKHEKLSPRLGWKRIYGSVSFEFAEMKNMSQSFKVNVTM